MATSRELSAPFRVDGSGGIAVITTSGRRADEYIRTAVGTARGERLMRADYGSQAAGYLFGNNDDLTASLLKDTISAAIHNWVDGVSLESVEVTSHEDTGALVAQIHYSLANGGVQTTSIESAVPVN